MSPVPCVVVFLVTLTYSLIKAQSSQLEWAPEELHSPLNNPRLCGLDSDAPGYICDPNGILGDHLNSVNWILKDAAHNSTNCPCSTYYCETEKGPKGYRIGVAIVRKMKKQNGLDGNPVSPVDLATLFAYRLESQFWAMGNCEEDIVIFYSHDDQLLTMYAGSTAQAKLTPYYRGVLAYKAGPYFKDGRVIEGFNNLLYDLKHILNCDTEEENASCGLNEIRNGAGISTSSLLLALVSALSVFVFRST